jgi:hypothetical protein
MENLKTKKICVIGDSQWCQKLMDITYEMGVSDCSEIFLNAS